MERSRSPQVVPRCVPLPARVPQSVPRQDSLAVKLRKIREAEDAFLPEHHPYIPPPEYADDLFAWKAHNKVDSPSKIDLFELNFADENVQPT